MANNRKKKIRSKHIWSSYVLLAVMVVITVGIAAEATGDYMRYWINGTRFAVDLDNGSVSIGQNPVQGWDFAVNGTTNFTGYIIYNGSEVCTAGNGLCGGGGGGDADNYTDAISFERSGSTVTLQLSRNNLSNLTASFTDQTGGGGFDLNFSGDTGSGTIDDTEVMSFIGAPTLNVTANVNTVELAVNTSYIQRRVVNSCVAGESIRTIAEDGTVVCEIDSTGTDTNNYTVSAAVHGTTSKTIQLEQATGNNITAPFTDLYDPDTNETTRVDAITDVCASGEFVQNVTDTGLQCFTPVDQFEADTNETTRVDQLVQDNITVRTNLIPGLNTSKADIGDCPTGYFAMNLTATGPECYPDQDTQNTYTNGTGLNLTSFVFSILRSYQLPQSCGNGEIAEYNTTSGGWDCAVDNSAASGIASFFFGNTTASTEITDAETIRVINGTGISAVLIGNDVQINSTVVDTDSNETTRVDAITADCGTGFVLQNITDTGLQCVPEMVDTDTNETTRVDQLVQDNITVRTNLIPGLNTSKADIGDCASGEFVQNLTSTGPECYTDQFEANTNNYSTSVAVTGTTTKTITINQLTGNALTDTWTDIDTDTNCNSSGACANGGVAYMNYSNNGNFNISGNLSIGDEWISQQGNLGLALTESGNDLVLTADATGTNSFFIDTQGTFLELIANPGPANGYLMFAIEETQGVATNIDFYEGGTGHNRIYSSGSIRLGGTADYLCDQFSGLYFPDCDTSATGADLIVQDVIWTGGNMIVGNGTHNLTVDNGVNLTGPVRSSSFIGALTGNSDTASALAADGADCTGGGVAAGVDASGIAAGCQDPINETELDSLAELITQVSAELVSNATDAELSGLNVTGMSYFGGLVDLNSTPTPQNISGVDDILFNDTSKIISTGGGAIVICSSGAGGPCA